MEPTSTASEQQQKQARNSSANQSATQSPTVWVKELELSAQLSEGSTPTNIMPDTVLAVTMLSSEQMHLAQLQLKVILLKEESNM